MALALAALGGDTGAEIDLSAAPAEEQLDEDARLFSESNSRFVVTCDPARAADLEAAFGDLPCARIGTVTADGRLRVSGARGRRLVDRPLDALRRAFQRPLWAM